MYRRRAALYRQPTMRIWGSAGTLTVMGLLIAAPASGAATIAVSTRADTVANDGLCSLREAVGAAETRLASGSAAGECRAGSGSDTIIVPAGAPYVLTGSLTISGIITLSGGGAGTTTIDGGGVARVLDVQPGATVSIQALAIAEGRAPDGQPATVGSPGGPGGPGGGIRNDGSLTLTDVTVSGNRAGNGGSGAYDDTTKTGSTGGIGGDGGGVYNTGSLTLDHAAVVGNAAGAGGTGGPGGSGFAGTGGAGGSGGGVSSTSAGALIILHSTVTGNHAGTGASSPQSAVGGNGGAGGAGGGVSSRGALSLSSSTLSANTAGDGGPGGIGNSGAAGGLGGQGGGLFDAASTSQTIVNDTIAGNASGYGGSGGDAGVGFDAGGNGNNGGSGGGIVSAGAPLQILDTTVARNLLGGGGAGGAGTPGGSGGDAGNGGAVSASGSAAAQNSIFSHNAGVGCLGTVLDNGHNLSFPDATCPGAHADPGLGPLADNGGPTATMALGIGSAAIDRVPASGAGCPATDERGVQRPQGGACDIGAFEVGVLPRNTVRPVIHGGAALACSTGTWTNFPQSFAYAWLRDGRLVAHAAAARYVPVGADVGHRLLCRVTASNQTGSASAQSAAVLIARPALSHLSLHPASFKSGRGTRISYTDRVAASTTFTVLRSASGVRQGHRCVKPGRRSKHGKRCTRYVTLGAFSHSDRAGKNSVHFTGRLGGNALRPGKYELIAVARIGGLHSRAVKVSFRVKH
jgi:hypothetical protein